MPKTHLILVEWDDVSSFDGWIEVSEAREKTKPFRATMVGWEISKNKDYLILATALSGEECNGRRAIPKGCIRNIRRIE